MQPPMTSRAALAIVALWVAGCAPARGAIPPQHPHGSEGEDVVVTGSRLSGRSASAPDGEADEDGIVITGSRLSSAFGAQAGPSAPAAMAPGGGEPVRATPASFSAVGSNERAAPVLIYEAQLEMAVHKVDEIQVQAVAIATELGGFLAEQADRERLVLRVPAQQFYPTLKRLEQLGEVARRFVKAQDVGDRVRDLQTRLRNAEAVRERLAALLVKAADVKQSLEVEHELDRITERIELLKGELKALGDKVAYSTIVMTFQIKESESLEYDVHLPFEWLQRLGLQPLLSFR